MSGFSRGRPRVAAGSVTVDGYKAPVVELWWVLSCFGPQMGDEHPVIIQGPSRDSVVEYYNLAEQLRSLRDPDYESLRGHCYGCHGSFNTYEEAWEWVDANLDIWGG